jgi:hypothetical protein
MSLGASSENSPVETELLVQADRLVGGRDAVLVVDDTAIAKKGAHSVGVAAQYASALGKTANCQTLVSLTLARGEVPVMLALRLFLPGQVAKDREINAVFSKTVAFYDSLQGIEALVADVAGDRKALRQSVFGRLAGYEDERCRTPAPRSGHALDCRRQGGSGPCSFAEPDGPVRDAVVRGT